MKIGRHVRQLEHQPSRDASFYAQVLLQKKENDEKELKVKEEEIGIKRKQVQ